MNRQAKKRPILASLILLAVVAGAWGNVLAAAFCPHIVSTHACYLNSSHPSQSLDAHDMHDMDMGQVADMQMGEMQMDMSAEFTDEASTQEQSEPIAEVEQNSGTTVVDQPIETCSHCLNHSRLPVGSVTLREAESAKRCANLTAAPQVIEQVSLTTLPSFMFDPREHAPPGSSSPRHILINVFRI